MIVRKVYIKSQLLGNHHETEPMGPFRSWHVSPLVLCLQTVHCDAQLSTNGKPAVTARTLEISFSYDFNKAVCGKMLRYCHHDHNEITVICSSSKWLAADVS